MNGNSDNHKPLSPEELFRLLESKREEEALSGEGLDDFEREALEGFSSYSSAGKARELTKEIHGLIDDAAGETKKTRSLPRLLWFGAAASLVFVIVLTAYFLTQQAKEAPELALNKQAADRDQKPAVPLTPEGKALAQEQAASPPLAEDKEAPKFPAKEPVLVQADDKGPETAATYKGASESRSENSAGPEIAFEKTKKEELTKDQSKATIRDELKTAETLEQEDQKMGYVSGVSNANQAPMPKEDLATKAPSKEKVQEETAVNTYDAVQPAGRNKLKLSKKKAQAVSGYYAEVPVTRALKTADNALPLEAYYTGGEKKLAIDVAAWLNARHDEVPKGSYSVRVKVSADGKVEASEVNALKEAGSGAEKRLKQALTELKGWKPAQAGGHPVDGEAVFILEL